LKAKCFFFILLFVGFLLTPTTLLIIDDCVDTTFIFSMTEEENNKDVEQLVSMFEVVFVSTFDEFHIYSTSQIEMGDKNFNLNHSKIYFETISPPPEFV
jgi:hypothetical protein